MNEFYDYLKDNGCTLTYCEVEENLLNNGEDIIETIQAGGRPAEREKRGC